MATVNVGIKINRAITGATTVNANCYAQVTYAPSAYSTPQNVDVAGWTGVPITRLFGPGQAIPATFTHLGVVRYTIGFTSINNTVTYTLLSGVEFINTI